MQDTKMSAVVLSPVDRWRETFAAYYELTKPGITLMVVLSAAAGFYLALPKNSHIYLTVEYALLFALTIVGTALVSAGSCALNQAVEAKYDETMKRTMFRPIPSGKIRVEYAVVFGIVLAVAGIALLSFASLLAAGLALLTLALYIGVYTPMKKVSSFNTLIGGIPGALPPLGGWVTVTGDFALPGIVLFMILFLWQMPHFLSLAWMYRKDYERGGFQMMTVNDESGIRVAKNTLVYTLLLITFTLMLPFLGVTGMIYFAVLAVLSAGFIYTALRFFFQRTNANARNVLLSSYFYLLAVITCIFIDKV